MANIKISDLTAAAAASGTQEFEVNDSLTSKKVTGAQLLAYVKANTTPGDIGALATTAGAVGENNLASSAVTTAKIADGAITSGKIADGTIATADIADGAVTSAKIADGTIVTADLANSAVTVAKISATGTPSSTTFLRGDGSWQSAGGAPSAIDAIGTVMTAAMNTTSVLKPNDTVSGSNCYWPSSYQSWPNAVITEGTASSKPRTFVTFPSGNWGDSERITSGNTGYNTPGGHTALSGTWRVLTFCKARSSSYSNTYGENETSSHSYHALIVRIA